MVIIARELFIVICYAATFTVADIAAIVYSPNIQEPVFPASTICINYRGSSENAFQPFKIIITIFFSLEMLQFVIISGAITYFSCNFPRSNLAGID